MTTFYARHSTPIGELLLVGSATALTGVYFPAHLRGPAVAAHWTHDPARFADLSAQLDRYLAGTAEGFDLAVEPAGTAFQRRVWDELRRFPYGETVTYGELAAALGRPGAARAVGGAVARNPVSIVIPCHRVVGSAGSLTGYAGTVERKRWLLDLEARRRAGSLSRRRGPPSDHRLGPPGWPRGPA